MTFSSMNYASFRKFLSIIKMKCNISTNIKMTNMSFNIPLMINETNKRLYGAVFQIDFEIFRTIASFNKISSGHSLIIKVEFAVVPTDTICGRNLSKIPVDMNSIFMKLYVTWPMWPKHHIPQKFEFLKWFLYFLDWWRILFLIRLKVS